MYTLHTPLLTVKGIGKVLGGKLAELDIKTVLDLLLVVPLRYEDRSHFTTVSDLEIDKMVTLQCSVSSLQTRRGGKRSFYTATARDATGSIKLMWFRKPFALNSYAGEKEYFVSGKPNKYKTIIHPVLEPVRSDALHTNRLVPLYSTSIGLKPGALRRVLKHIVDNLMVADPLESFLEPNNLPSLAKSLKQLHFPDEDEKVISARKRLAIDELLGLIQVSKKKRAKWQAKKDAKACRVERSTPSSIPFTLTSAQQKSTSEILDDISQDQPMNRLLVGDVGSGKTVVAGTAALSVLKNNWNAAIVAPTKILAEQHARSLTGLFPDMSLQLITAGLDAKNIKTNKPTLFVGTHAVINRFSTIKPALIIYDEQHRFGVVHRSASKSLPFSPHILTMSATPIPRSLMLSIFSHLSLSLIDELPAGRKPVKTWLVPERKRLSSYDWLASCLKDTGQQALVVCPFIEESKTPGFEKIAATTKKTKEISDYLKKAKSGLKVGQLHARLKKQEQQDVIDKLYNQEIDILVTTPMIEVGLDLPKAAIIIIEAAERFGLASLHQLRGRVGRANQEAYCLLFPTVGVSNRQRLKMFSQISSGQELAELDLKTRGAGELFGTQQHGTSTLRFASWTDAGLISLAKDLDERLDKAGTVYAPILGGQLGEVGVLGN